MARISKPGLDYFPLDVNFFQDRKVRRISNRHHAAGIAALTSLLCLIYKEKGFYVAWNQDTLFDISQEVCCEEEEMQAIIDDCLSVGLFDTWPGLILPYITFALPLAIYARSYFKTGDPAGVWFWPLLARRALQDEPIGVAEVVPLLQTALLAGLKHLPRSLAALLVEIDRLPADTLRGR